MAQNCIFLKSPRRLNLNKNQSTTPLSRSREVSETHIPKINAQYLNKDLEMLIESPRLENNEDDEFCESAVLAKKFIHERNIKWNSLLQTSILTR